MGEQWYAIYDQATGRLESTGTVVADDVTLAAKGFIKQLLPGRPDFDTQEWNAAAATFVPRPPRPDVVAQFMADPAIATLPSVTQTTLEAKLDQYFGLRRKA